MKIGLRLLTILLILTAAGPGSGLPARAGAEATPGARPSPAQGDDKATAPQRVSFCDLAGNPKRYDGQLIVTEAVVANSYRSMVLFDPLCSQLSSPGGVGYAQPSFDRPYKLGTSLDKEFRKFLIHDGDVRILFVGMVESSRDSYGLDSHPFQIDIRYLVSIYRISPAESQLLGIGPARR